jgi:hypothetical protein
MLVKQIQFFGKELELLTELEQKAIKGGGRGRGRGRGNQNRDAGSDSTGTTGGNDGDVDPGCPPDYED